MLRQHAVVGTQLFGVTELVSQPIKMRSAGESAIWIDVSCRLGLDEDEGKFLTVQASVCSLHFGDRPSMLLHYDYERGKKTFTEAHLQVHARHEGLESYLGELRRKQAFGLHKIHLPVGGRRFRPALEDLLECLVDEKLVDPKPDWQEILNQSRDRYRRRQAAAVVRRDPDCAVEELERLGYQVIPPTDANLRAANARQPTPNPRDGGRGAPTAKQRNSRR
nr:hypothetical protein [Micromonospora sp. DSM 115978]